MLAQRLPDISWPEHEGWFTRQARAALGRMLEAQDPALQRMHTLETDSSGKINECLDEAVDRHSGCHRPAQQGLHVLWRIVERPCLMIDRLPLLPAHSRMCGADMLDVVIVEVRIHRDAL